MGTNLFGTVVEGVFRRNGSLKRIRAELSVYYWPKIAGSEIAKNVKAVRYFNGYLYLKTESSTLAHQLMMMNADIIKRYRQLIGPDIIKGIKVKVGTVERDSREVVKETGKPSLDEAEVHFIEENCQNITDSDLSHSFKKLMQKAYEVKHRMNAQGANHCLSCNVVIDRVFSYCPVCEIKLKEEMVSYISYLKKNNKEVKISDLPLEINEMNEKLIRQMLNL